MAGHLESVLPYKVVYNIGTPGSWPDPWIGEITPKSIFRAKVTFQGKSRYFVISGGLARIWRFGQDLEVWPGSGGLARIWGGQDLEVWSGSGGLAEDLEVWLRIWLRYVLRCVRYVLRCVLYVCYCV